MGGVFIFVVWRLYLSGPIDQPAFTNSASLVNSYQVSGHVLIGDKCVSLGAHLPHDSGLTRTVGSC